MKVGIIGNGFVGNAIYQNLKDKIEDLLVFDVDEFKSLNSHEDTISSDIVFVCLPTPMKDKMGGECNLTYVEEFFDSLPDNLSGIFVIKSTVPIGTTKKLSNKRKDLKVIHNPEFLTARNSVEDFNNADRNIIGGEEESSKKLESFYSQYFPHIPTFLVSSDESEAIKYFSNTYLSVKVAYFNLMYDLCEKIGMDYENVRRCVSLDKRIGESHTFVPGVDGDRGFGGTCFPKDLNALNNTFKQHNLNESILEEIWKYNMQIRNVIDW
jgi:UDPglucose 6-dehydrogenase